MNKDGSKSGGILQQSDRYPVEWPDPFDVPTATRAFLKVYRERVKNPAEDVVRRCWRVQQWNWDNPDQTNNYRRRVPLINRIITDRKLP